MNISKPILAVILSAMLAATAWAHLQLWDMGVRLARIEVRMDLLLSKHP